MSGNIKYIGEKTPEVKPLPTKGYVSQSNSNGKDAALNKFILSFTQEGSLGTKNTKTEMEREFPQLSKILAEQGADAVKQKLQVKQEPADNRDCSVFTISKKTPIESSVENSGSPMLVREDNGEEINSLKEENQQLKEQTLIQTNEMAQKLDEMLNKKQVEIAELQLQLQLKQEGEKDVVLLLEKEIKLLKLFDDKMDLYRLRNEIGTKVNMDLQKTINSMKTLLETTKQTREQVSQSDFQPTTAVIKEKSDTPLSQSDFQPITVEIMEKADTALLVGKNIIAEFEKQSKNEKAAAEPPIVVELPSVAPPTAEMKNNAAKTVSKTKTISEKQKLTFVNDFKKELIEMTSQIDKNAKTFVLNSIEIDSLDVKFKNALDLYKKIHNVKPPDFNGGKSRRHGKRIKSHKPHSYKNKNKTKTKRCRKRSSTRRRK
jgi:hypothetical protein